MYCHHLQMDASPLSYGAFGEMKNSTMGCSIVDTSMNQCSNITLTRRTVGFLKAKPPAFLMTRSCYIRNIYIYIYESYVNVDHLLWKVRDFSSLEAFKRTSYA